MSKKKGAKLSVLSESKIAKKYSSGKASVIGLTPENTLRIPSRVLKLNYQLNGGLGYGKILELFGEESTGKTLLAMDFAYSTIALGGEVIWEDAENSWNNYWGEKNGLDLDKIHLHSTVGIETISDHLQDMCLTLRSRLTNNQPILAVVDSVGAGRCVAEVGEYALDASAKYGNRAKAWSDLLGNRNEIFARLGIGVIFINQLRKKIGASQWEDPDKTVGGDALKYYAHQRIGLYRGKQIKAKKHGEETKVGQNIYVRTKKDKTGPPREATETQVYFLKSSLGNVGFSKYSGLPELLVKKGVVERSKGSSRYYKDGNQLAHGEENFLELLLENDELRGSLIKESEINTISRTQAKLDSLTTNLFPVALRGKQSDDEDEE